MTYGLKQSQGGPCGVFAAVQARVVETLLFDPNNAGTNDSWGVNAKESPLVCALPDKEKIQRSQERLLSVALAKVLAQARRDNNAPVTIVVNQASAIDDHTDKQLVIHTNLGQNAVESVANSIFENITSYQSKGGVLLFLYSVIATRGIQNIQADMDDSTQNLTLAHGHCSQELMNLLICGYSTSQVHDGNIPMGDTGLTLNGVNGTPRIGYLTFLEALRYCTVGEYYKTPEVPVWVIGSDSHFTVLFATNSAVGMDSPEEKSSKVLRRVFNKFDASGGGFVQRSQLQQVLQELIYLEPAFCKQNPGMRRVFGKGFRHDGNWYHFVERF